MPTSAARPAQRLRSAASNDPLFLQGVDGRSKSARRYRDLLNDIGRECGGLEQLSETGRSLARQAAAMTLRSEQLQAAVVRSEPVDADEMIRLAAEVRRVMAALRNEQATSPERW